ncbi:hypothetical protein SAMN02910314_01524 [Denitrobacterium detoxificans]|uniref:Uncharacterized protein n=1 Tax=Denitrobacterium detoxificans TaxID=79604 RepID=A0A1H8TFR4_9ACTN|nr:hypothetical protein SAMN02910314_01524 [Denitrobacterium detoxificans]
MKLYPSPRSRSSGIFRSRSAHD